MLYLFAKPSIGCKESIPLAVDGRVCTSSDRVHLPMGVVVVHHMKVPMTASTI
ncbi:hypothetical protein HanIR_Chr05g0246711 [Helianthus annuus]|nr:hypothetical protein HanIR_Chr05g0246711 [Helianthus annuus]